MITLTWNDNSQHEDSFKIFQGAALIHTTAANVESYPVTGLTPGHTYTFSVKAYNAVAGYSSASSGDIGTEEPFVPIITDPPPNKPSGLAVTPLSTVSVRLNWLDNSNNEVDFHIEQSPTSDPGDFVQVATVGANITTYTASGLTPAAQYWFRVRAHNAVAYSGYSNIATTSAFADIAPPTNVVATPISLTVCEVTFDDNSTLEDSHHYEIETDGIGGFIDSGTLAPNRTYFTVTMSAAIPIRFGSGRVKGRIIRATRTRRLMHLLPYRPIRRTWPYRNIRTHGRGLPGRRPRERSDTALNRA